MDDVISKEEEMIPPLSRHTELVPLTSSSGQLFPSYNITCIFGADLLSSLMTHSRRYVKELIGPEYHQVRRMGEVLLINVAKIQLRVH